MDKELSDKTEMKTSFQFIVDCPSLIIDIAFVLFTIGAVIIARSLNVLNKYVVVGIILARLIIFYVDLLLKPNEVYYFEHKGYIFQLPNCYVWTVVSLFSAVIFAFYSFYCCYEKICTYITILPSLWDNAHLIIFPMIVAGIYLSMIIEKVIRSSKPIK